MSNRQVKNFNKLNFGCGNDVLEDFWNVDIVPTGGSDQNFDFNSFPYPLEDEHFECILAKQVLEHLDDLVHTVYEFHRLLKVGGVANIYVPYWTSPNTWVHPQHTRAFNYETLDYFVQGSFRNMVDGHWVKSVYSSITKHISFYKKFQPWNYVIEPLVNLCRASSLYYEYTCLHNIFPADGIYYHLKK